MAMSVSHMMRVGLLRGVAMAKGNAQRVRFASSLVTIPPPQFMLAKEWDPARDPTGWWASEKLEGLRAWWDGQRFVSRKGTVIVPPKWFCDDLPKNVILDGEIWSGKGSVYSCLLAFKYANMAAAKQSHTDERWEHLKFFVIDAPFLDKPFEDRIREASKSISRHTGREFVEPFLTEEKLSSSPPYPLIKEGVCHPITHIKIRNRSHMERLVADVIDADAEGLMLRRSGSPYHLAQRSKDMCKFKTWHDEYALVVKHHVGKKGYTGMLGGVEVETPDGRNFSIGAGFDSEDRMDPPPIGSVISYRYFTKTPNNIPRSPTFLKKEMIPWETLRIKKSS
eukprot:TRINITY_DN5059_c0_g1_i5.p1 TRINITY_DN5059_c0_g1~~TRINITY_DN5059_c0_g1_i5.p1  ORF type:complete len:337 (+),score=57.42 TRINITY_DN5059_c0_g1_i5:47-1057(+)